MESTTESTTKTVSIPRRESLTKKEKGQKLGHRRVTGQGTVTYKKKATSELQNAIQLGISNIVGRAESSRDVLLRDFQTIETVDFPSRGSKHTPAHSYSDFQFKTIAPVAFSFFRRLFLVDKSNYLSSVCAEPLRELSNPGASGSVFFISHDDEFIIKTVQHKEANFLMKLLPQYYMNLTQHPRTLLPKFYGLHCYQSTGKNIRIVLMNNLLPSSIEMHEKYDLKGSTYKRKASEKERSKKHPTLKDLDFKRNHTNGIFLRPETYDSLKRTIERDCLVLASLNIMDYSFLLGIHNLSQARRNKEAENATPTSSRQDLTCLSEHHEKEKVPASYLFPRITLKRKYSKRFTGRFHDAEDGSGLTHPVETENIDLVMQDNANNYSPTEVESGSALGNAQQVLRQSAARSRSVKRIAAYSTPMAILEGGEHANSDREHDRKVSMGHVGIPLSTIHEPPVSDILSKEETHAGTAVLSEGGSGSSAYGTHTGSETGSYFSTELVPVSHKVSSTTTGAEKNPFVSTSSNASSTTTNGSGHVAEFQRQLTQRSVTSTAETVMSSTTAESMNSSMEERDKFEAPAVTVIESTSEELKEMGGISAWNSQGDHLILFPGVIDILQDYRIRKRMEHAFKSIVTDGDTVSVHEPGFYSNRFQTFLLNQVFHKLPSYVPSMIPTNQLNSQTPSTNISIQLPNLYLKEVDSPFLESMRRLRQDSSFSETSNYSSLARSNISRTSTAARSRSGITDSPARR